MTQSIRFTPLVFILATISACGPTERELMQQAAEANLQKTRTSFSTMVARHNASLDWDRRVKEHSPAFSIDVQEAIAAMTGRSLVVFGLLSDIYSKDGQGYIVIEAESASEDEFFVLDIQEDLRRSITSLQDAKYGRFAFVVRPTGSSVPLLRALVEPGNEDIQIESADAVVVQGHLVDFLWLDGITAEQVRR